MGVSEVLLCPYRCLEYKMERLERSRALSSRLFHGGVRNFQGGPSSGLRRNLVQSGAFLQEIDVFPVFHHCERKHCHSARQWY